MDDEDKHHRSRSKSKSKSRKNSKSGSKSRENSKSRSKSRSKSPGTHKEKRKSKKDNDGGGFGWWDFSLENYPDLVAALEAEGLREKAKLAEQEALLQRRQELIQKYMDKHRRRLERDEAQKSDRSIRTSGVAQRFLQQVQQKERETKPIILNSVRATPLKIDVSSWEAPKYKKDADEKAVIKSTAKRHFLFRDQKESANNTSTSRINTNLNLGIPSNTVAMLIKAFEPVNIDKGQNIIQQGKYDQHMYVVDKGTVEFQVDGEKETTQHGQGTTFGDQNLLHAAPAEKTVVATEDMKVFRLHQETYRGIMQQRHLVEDVKKQQKEKERKKLEKEEAERKKMEQEEAKRMQQEIGEEKEQEIEDETEFTEETIEETNWWEDSESGQLQMAIRNALLKVHQDDLERIKVLGEGQFGEVWLVAADLELDPVMAGNSSIDEDTQRYEFALKLQATYDEYRENTALSEMKVMKELSGHPFVSMLYRSYETEDSLDMLLGLIPGGELWDTVHKEDKETGDWYSGLSEGHSRFYAMVVADTLDYLHSKSYVFRDLKPENIMIDGWGYPVIVDFGFCKKLAKGREDKTFTFCGTPNYVSPEIVLNVGHNGAADCWALGIVIYEMVSGENPFFYDDIDQVELYRSICEDAGEPLDRKKHSRQVRKLVDALLVKDPDKRLGAKEMLDHPWFEGLSLTRLRNRQVKPPWIPEGGEGERHEYLSDGDDDDEAAKAIQKKREQQVENELRIRQLQEEKRRLEEEARQREEELRLEQERLEEEARREEEERLERERLEEEARKEEEERLEQERLEEEARREEEERLEQERLEEEERLEQERQERKARRREEKRREKERLEFERLEQERLEEEARWEEEERLELERLERLQREIEEQERLEELERQRQEEILEEQRRAEEDFKNQSSERSLENVFGDEDLSMSPSSRSPKRWENPANPYASRRYSKSIDELVSPVPKGIVEKILNDSMKSPRRNPTSPSPGALDVQRSVRSGIVAKRLSKAKEKEDPGNVPSLFASFSLLEKK